MKPFVMFFEPPSKYYFLHLVSRRFWRVTKMAPKCVPYSKLSKFLEKGDSQFEYFTFFSKRTTLTVFQISEVANFFLIDTKLSILMVLNSTGFFVANRKTVTSKIWNLQHFEKNLKFLGLSGHASINLLSFTLQMDRRVNITFWQKLNNFIILLSNSVEKSSN